MGNTNKKIQAKLTKGLLDLIVLQFLKSQPMHGYQIITTIRKSFGIYFGPSTIYPLLATLEKKGFVNSEWNIKNEKPRKVYKLTKLHIQKDNFNQEPTIETSKHSALNHDNQKADLPKKLIRLTSRVYKSYLKAMHVHSPECIVKSSSFFRCYTHYAEQQ
jgi:PadR family transcriptional regulator PadR